MSIAMKENQIISKEELDLIRDFLNNGVTNIEYPEIEENEAGMVMKQMLKKLYGDKYKYKEFEYLQLRYVRVLKEKVRGLFRESASRFVFDNTTGIFKSLFVIFANTPTCSNRDNILKYSYYVGYFTENLMEI